jgi:hypothetical protein
MKGHWICALYISPSPLTGEGRDEGDLARQHHPSPSLFIYFCLGQAQDIENWVTLISVLGLCPKTEVNKGTLSLKGRGSRQP